MIGERGNQLMPIKKGAACVHAAPLYREVMLRVISDEAAYAPGDSTDSIGDHCQNKMGVLCRKKSLESFESPRLGLPDRLARLRHASSQGRDCNPGFLVGHNGPLPLCFGFGFGPTILRRGPRLAFHLAKYASY